MIIHKVSIYLSKHLMLFTFKFIFKELFLFLLKKLLDKISLKLFNLILFIFTKETMIFLQIYFQQIFQFKLYSKKDFFLIQIIKKRLLQIYLQKNILV